VCWRRRASGKSPPEIVERRADEADKTRALASANYCSGFRIDLDAIGALCAERGVLFSVDAIQPGRFSGPVEAHRFSSAPARKNGCSSIGAGILYIKKPARFAPAAIMRRLNVVSRISSRNAK